MQRNASTPQVVVDYRKLTGEPRVTVREIYHALGMNYGGAYDAYLQGQEAREKGHKTHFEYSIDDYEVSRERIETELGDFYAEFDWPRAQQQPASQENEQESEQGG